VVSWALDVGLLGLVCESAFAVGPGRAGQAALVGERPEVGAADAVLDERLAEHDQRARVRRAGPALEVVGGVLEGVGLARGAEARAVAAAKLAGGAGAAHVGRVALVAEAADAVAASLSSTF